MKATLNFHIMHFPPIENHYKEKYNVSGLLNEEELLNHNLFIIERIFVCTVFSVYFIHTVIVTYCYYCNKKTVI